VTTEKDEQNLAAVNFGKLPVYIAVIDLAIPAHEFRPALERLLGERGGS